MAEAVKVRAKTKGDVTIVKPLMTHPMETGNRKDRKTGQKLPEHYLTEVTRQHNGKTVLTAHWGPSVSKNRYLSYEFTRGKAGDTVTINRVDNKDESGSGEATIS